MPSTDEFESRYLVASGGEHFERRTLHIIRGGFFIHQCPLLALNGHQSMPAERPNTSLGYHSPDTLARIEDHKINRIDQLMPWCYAQA